MFHFHRSNSNHNLRPLGLGVQNIYIRPKSKSKSSKYKSKSSFFFFRNYLFLLKNPNPKLFFHPLFPAINCSSPARKTAAPEAAPPPRLTQRKMLERESITNPITHSKTTGLPRKRFYRARAHSNPLSDSHFPVPISPTQFDYTLHYTHSDFSKKIEFADIGCGFGGLLISLATLFPNSLMIGMELRDKVTEYVKERILALRASNPGQYENVSVVRTNSMKYIPNYFEKGQLTKMFFLFPDPHFKEKNHRRRVISPHLLDEYAYVLGVGGVIYTITDVEELGEWMKSCLDGHPLFEPLSKDELEADPVVELLSTATEEGQKVARNEGQTFRAVYRRVASSGLPH